METPYDDEREDERTRARNRDEAEKDERARRAGTNGYDYERTRRCFVTRGERNRFRSAPSRFETVSAPARRARSRAPRTGLQHRTFEDESYARFMTSRCCLGRTSLGRRKACWETERRFQCWQTLARGKHAPRFVGERANATMDPETIALINLLECLSEDHPVRLPSPFPPRVTVRRSWKTHLPLTRHRTAPHPHPDLAGHGTPPRTTKRRLGRSPSSVRSSPSGTIRPEARDLSVPGGSRALSPSPRADPRNAPPLDDTARAWIFTAESYRDAAFKHGIPFRR